jgi:hypothetical protein
MNHVSKVWALISYLPAAWNIHDMGAVSWELLHWCWSTGCWGGTDVVWHGWSGWRQWLPLDLGDCQLLGFPRVIESCR